MAGADAVIGWVRVHLLHKERCACTSLTCPYTLGRGWHVTPNNPVVSREPWPPSRTQSGDDKQRRADAALGRHAEPHEVEFLAESGWL